MDSVEKTSWYAEWCEPIVVALYGRDADGIYAALEAARQAAESGKLNEIDSALLTYQVCYLEHQAYGITRDPAWGESRRQVVLDTLGTPGKNEKAENLRKRLYLQMRIAFDRADVTALYPEEFENLFSDLPQAEHTTEVWHYISSWAFKYNDPLYLEKAYEFAVSHARGFNVAWAWQRVHIMWQMVKGSATRNDLSWLVKRAEILQQLRSIQKRIWTRARERDLIDERLDILIRERELELTRHQDQRVFELLRPHMSAHTASHTASRHIQASM